MYHVVDGAGDRAGDVGCDGCVDDGGDVCDGGGGGDGDGCREPSPNAEPQPQPPHPSFIFEKFLELHFKRYLTLKYHNGTLDGQEK